MNISFKSYLGTLAIASLVCIVMAVISGNSLNKFAGILVVMIYVQVSIVSVQINHLARQIKELKK